MVFPKSVEGKVNSFLASLRDGMGKTGKAFEQGFARVFAIRGIRFITCPVHITGLADDRVEQAYRDAITDVLQRENQIDAAIVVLQDRHAFLPGLSNPYLRTKALLMTLGIPVQEIRVDTLNKDKYPLSYTLQNFSVALYAKLNGTPWTVNQDRQIGDELVVGMGFAELSGSRIQDRQRHVGITTVFSGDGTYVLGNVSRECRYSDYPKVVRTSMLSILKDVKQRNNWQPGDRIRVIFHAHRPLRRIDIAQTVFECTREVGSEQDVQLAFVTVTHSHPFVLLDRNERGVPVKKRSSTMKGAYAPKRGTIAHIGRSSRLLAVNSGYLIKRGTHAFAQARCSLMFIRIDLHRCRLPLRTSAEIYLPLMAFHSACTHPSHDLLFRAYRGTAGPASRRAAVVDNGTGRESALQPMVPVKHIIESPLAAIQVAARRQLGKPIDWPDLAGALAIRICERFNLSYPESWLTDIRKSNVRDFRRAPVIAAYGPVLDRVSPSVREEWETAIETLRGRTPFPGDRGSFEYSPRELVGVACGLALLDPDPRDHNGWFTNLLLRGLESYQFNNPQLHLAAMMALHHVDPTKAKGTRRETPDIESLSMRELSLVAQLSFATWSDDILSPVSIEAAFERRHAVEPVRVNDACEAATMMHLCGRIIDKLALRNASASALDTVLALVAAFISLRSNWDDAMVGASR